jgi:16S rRNA (uracil1498-N3)-methyltransferase
MGGPGGATAVIRLALLPERWVHGIARLTPEEVHYLFRVMRCQAGDRVEAWGPGGALYLAEVDSVHQALRLLEPLPREEQGAEAPFAITLYQSLLKGDRFAEVVEKGTELGMAAFVPVVSERSVVREASPARQRRWQAVAKEASEQCRRATLPQVHPVTTLGEALALRQAGAFGLALHPHGLAPAEWLQEVASRHGGAVELWVGPEGGFSPVEVERLKAAGISVVSLGPLIWRAENAGIWATAMIWGAKACTLRAAANQAGED